MHDTELQARFDKGNEEERKIMRDLLDLGFDVVSGQETLEMKNTEGEVIGVGRIDAKIRVEREKYPFEIKSMNPNVFNRIDSIEDFEKKPYLRKYLRQLRSYMLVQGLEQGFFLCTDCLGHWKLFPVYHDEAEAEIIRNRLQRVHVHIAAKTTPDRIKYDREMCGKCPFAHICLPDVINEGLDMIEEEDLLIKARKREEFVDAARQFKKIDKELKERFKLVGKDFILGGEFLVERKPYDQEKIDEKLIPPELKVQYLKTTEIVKISIVPIGKKGE